MNLEKYSDRRLQEVTNVTDSFTDAELEAYLDETLDSDRAAEVEQGLKNNQSLLERLAQINGRRDAGVHTLGEIWRRNQIGVPNACLLYTSDAADDVSTV